MLPSVFLSSGDVVGESTTLRYIGRTGRVDDDGWSGTTLRFPGEVGRPGDPAADAPGDGKGDCNGADRRELLSTPDGFVNCGGGGESAELAEDTG
jgi:hypothetical protein